MNYKYLLENRGRAAQLFRLTAYLLLIPAFCLLAFAAAARGQQQMTEVERITVDELKAMQANNQPVTIIDARAQGSYDASDSKIKGAIRMGLDVIESRLSEIPRDREIVTYCT